MALVGLTLLSPCLVLRSPDFDTSLWCALTSAERRQRITCWWCCSWCNSFAMRPRCWLLISLLSTKTQVLFCWFVPSVHCCKALFIASGSTLHFFVELHDIPLCPFLLHLEVSLVAEHLSGASLTPHIFYHHSHGEISHLSQYLWIHPMRTHGLVYV